MNWQQLNPWNWFKHEENEARSDTQIPIKRANRETTLPSASTELAHPIARLHSDINRMFDDLFGRAGFPGFTGRSLLPDAGGFRPSLNIASNEKNYQVTVDLPGMKQSDVSIELQGDALMISGNKEEKSEQKDQHYYRIERSYGSFRRTLALPKDADTEAISASMADGVLELNIPRRETARTDVKQIPIH